MIKKIRSNKKIGNISTDRMQTRLNHSRRMIRTAAHYLKRAIISKSPTETHDKKITLKHKQPRGNYYCLFISLY